MVNQQYFQPTNRMFSTALNFINLFGWLAVLFTTTYKLYLCITEPIDIQKTPLIKTIDISFEVFLVQIVQGLQVFDILLILIGKSKGSFLSSLAQIVGRMIVAYVFISKQTERAYFFLMVLMWSFADANRYLYYIFKNETSAMMRYNLFIVLYPVGVTGEMLVINNYIKRNVEQLTIDHINMIRIVQLGIIIGMVFLYFYMLSCRSKYYRSLKKENQEMGKDKKVSPKRD